MSRPFDPPPAVCQVCGTEWEDEHNLFVYGSDCCMECYVNESCPDACAGDHDAPQPDVRGQWECPETGTVYRCEGEPGDLIWEVDRYDEGSDRINEYWSTDPYRDGYLTCDGCGEWAHYESDEIVADEDGDYQYHASCAPPGVNSSADEGRYACCMKCGNGLYGDIHFDPETEETYCSEHVPAIPYVKLMEAA